MESKCYASMNQMDSKHTTYIQSSWALSKRCCTNKVKRAQRGPKKTNAYNPKGSEWNVFEIIYDTNKLWIPSVSYIWLLSMTFYAKTFHFIPFRYHGSISIFFSYFLFDSVREAVFPGLHVMLPSKSIEDKTAALSACLIPCVSEPSVFLFRLCSFVWNVHVAK